MGQNRSRSPNVLLVEDQVMIALATASCLAERGFEVTCAANAHEALLHLRSAARIDALFTDIDLGGPVDGSMVAAIARELRPGLAVLYTSGRSTLEEFRAVSGSEFIPKPYDLDRVSSLLRQLMAMRDARVPHVA